MEIAVVAVVDREAGSSAASYNSPVSGARQLHGVVSRDVMIVVMTSLAKARDNETGNHLRRTAHYIKALAEKLSSHPRFSAFLTPGNIDVLFKSAPLHDIGKVSIPDHILLKPGRYEPAEFEVMKNHARLGHEMITDIESQLGCDTGFLSCAKEIILSHHEKWDGSGYPQKLVGDEIPIPARLMAIADVYDALISRRSYKQSMPHDKAMSIMVEGRGTHFDPDIFDAFVSIQGKFINIAERFMDTEETLRDSHFLSAIPKQA